MWRRPHWGTLFLALGVIVIGGRLFIGSLSRQEPIPCLSAVPQLDSFSIRNKGGVIQNTNTQFHTAGLPFPLEAPLGRGDGDLRMSQRGRFPQGQAEGRWGGMRKPDPRVFRLNSEMNSTVHVWPWPETQATFSVCAKKDWYSLGALPTVTIIVSFHNNENIFNIVHTLHAIVKRTPKKLLQEIILIDDNTFKDEFVQLLEMHLDVYFASLVRLVRSRVDLGLIRARLNGIRAARGRVVVVMDSHVEPQKDWLEPILYEIMMDRRTLASPYLDWMQKEYRVWNYRHGASSWKTYFDWTFTFGFQAMSEEETARRTDPTEPVRSAVTVGTVWGMDKAWFEEVGAFDDAMLRWGGENLDLAIRVWLFGGRVVNIPCSHVAHLEKVGARDYRNSWTEMIHKNYKRFAEVWVDDYKKYFYEHHPNMPALEVGDLSERFKIKVRAIHNFTWFLKNVFPELGIPDVNVYGYGGLQSLAGGCFDTVYSMSPVIVDCSPTLIDTQGIFWTKLGLLRLPMNVVTGQVSGGWGTVMVYEYTGYHNSSRASTWFHVKDGPIIETASGLCLTSNQRILTLSKCQPAMNQYWRFRFYSQDYNQLALAKLPAFAQYIPLLANRNRPFGVTVNDRELVGNFLGPNPYKQS